METISPPVVEHLISAIKLAILAIVFVYMIKSGILRDEGFRKWIIFPLMMVIFQVLSKKNE